jgi:FkbM family methyltransferase
MSAPPLALLLDKKPPAVQVIDIGAALEGGDRYQILVDQGLAHVTGFEPNPRQMEILAKRRGPYTYHPVFLGDGNEATFHITRFPGCCSLLEPDPAVIDLFTAIGATEPDDNFTVVRREQVQTVRLDDVPGLVAPDYLKIDVQGSEFAVLRNGCRTLESALVVEAEAEFVALYKGQPLFGDLQLFLRDRGFVLHKLVDLAGRSFRPLRRDNPCEPISQLLWSDAVFVRDFSRLDRYDDDQLLKAGLVLNDVYRSYDLTHLLLAEHDRRTGGTFATRYCEALAGVQNLEFSYLTQRLMP